jgi:hypothetical protein
MEAVTEAIVALPELLDLVEALADHTTDSYPHVRALVAIVRAGGPPELLDRADDLPAHIADRLEPRDALEWQQNEASTEIVPTMAARHELLGRAEEVAARITDPEKQAKALAMIGTAGGRLELFDRAAKVAATHWNPSTQVSALAEIVQAGGPLQLLDQAEELAGRLGDPRQEANALVVIVQAGGSAELLDRAAELAANPRSAFRKEAREEVTLAIVRAMAVRPELMARAEEVAAGMTTFYRDDAFGAIVDVMVTRPELLAQAEEVTARIADPEKQALGSDDDLGSDDEAAGAARPSAGRRRPSRTHGCTPRSWS